MLRTWVRRRGADSVGAVMAHSDPPPSPAIDRRPLTMDVHRRGDSMEIALARPGSGDVSVSATVAAVERLVSSRPAAADWQIAAEHPPAGLDPLIERVADALGLVTQRELLQLRRPLPVPSEHPAAAAAPPVSVRAFRPGLDDAAWIEVNNRAFASHPDQGQETPTTLGERMAEGWFDPSGFLVSDDTNRPGSFSGFCWTKVHPATDSGPAVGEIYVIGVDPSHQGEGLGAAFVLAGLTHLATQGITVANLYVEADNQAALALYDRLGFDVHQRRRVYGR